MMGMMGSTTLGNLIEWLEQQDPTLVVREGFSTPHSDRGNYDELAFTPEPTARLGGMLDHARSALGKPFQGYKGGSYVMNGHTPVLIGKWGECGEEITTLNFKYWLLTGALSAAREDATDGVVSAGFPEDAPVAKKKYIARMSCDYWINIEAESEEAAKAEAGGIELSAWFEGWSEIELEEVKPDVKT